MVQTETDITVITIQKAWKIPVIIPGVDIGGLDRQDQELIAEHGLAAWLNGMVKAFSPNNPIVVPAKKAPKVRRECVNCGEWFSSAKNTQFCGASCASQAARQQALRTL